MSPRGRRGGGRAGRRPRSSSFQDLKKRIDKLAEEAGLAEKISTTVTPDGLKIRLITDGVLFDSGSAVVKPGGRPTLEEIGRIIDQEASHPVQVEGHTDDRPIATSQYPSNWQLSGARAAAVVQQLNGARRVRQAHVAGRLRRAAPGRGQRDARGPGEEPPGRDHPDPSAWSNPVARRRQMNKKN